MTNLFEYKNRVTFNNTHFNDLEVFLDEVWSKRETSNYFVNDNEDKNIEVQRFLQFFHKDQTLKSNKYVGVIHFKDETINLLPKIFYNAQSEHAPNVKAINKHILWWLSYCRKLKFPNYLSGLNTEKADFFEILIYLFSKYTRTLLNGSIYQKYTEVSRELSFVKGRIDFNTYINDNLTRGRTHKIGCEFDAFEVDNDFNRGVKYVANLLLSVTKEQQSKRFLRDILFILDEVKDVTVNADILKRMRFNPMFSDFETVRDYCVLFLENSVSFNYKSDLKLFAFLLPMEYVFEDFIFGFIDKEIQGVYAKSQLSNTYLDKNKHFNLKPDLYLKVNNDRSIIADTKYKIVYADSNDAKKGISQSDLYQMVSYGIRFKVKEIVLYYPNTITQTKTQNSEIIIEDKLASDTDITIRSYQLPIINFGMFTAHYVNQNTLELDFEIVKKELIEAIETSIKID